MKAQALADHLAENPIDEEYKSLRTYFPDEEVIMVEEEVDGEPWFYDIKEYLKMGICPEQATGDQKRALRCLSNGFFLSGGILYRRTPDLGLLRCIDAGQAMIVMAEVHAGICGPHMSGYILAKKILRAGYYWLTMEHDCITFMRKCH
ncbi:uncharacterized protein [Nicotiana sylvestris]|uniref:uncharacterized protein n=1 Tax=Nicotiana sylvestris TaxID=4096 RepID=UPI00388C9663